MSAREAIAKDYGIEPRLISVPLNDDVRNKLHLPEKVIRGTADKMCHFFGDQFSITDEELAGTKTFRDIERLCRKKDLATYS